MFWLIRCLSIREVKRHWPSTHSLHSIDKKGISCEFWGCFSISIIFLYLDKHLSSFYILQAIDWYSPFKSFKFLQILSSIFPTHWSTSDVICLYFSYHTNFKFALNFIQMSFLKSKTIFHTNLFNNVCKPLIHATYWLQ